MSTIDSTRSFQEIKAMQRDKNTQQCSQTISGYLLSNRSFRISHHNHTQETQTLLSNQDQRDWMQSIQRRFQLQLEKQKQLSSIITNKLQQQVDFLKLQNQTLKSKLTDQKIQIDNLTTQIQQTTYSQQNTSLVMPQTANTLKIMLQTLQQEHEHCIQMKKDLLNTIQTHEIKIKLFQNQNKNLQNANKLLQKQLRDTKNQSQLLNQLQSKNQQYKKQIQSLRRQINSLKQINHQNKLQFNNQLQQLHQSIQQLQQQHQEISENDTIKQRDSQKQQQTSRQSNFLPTRKLSKQNPHLNYLNQNSHNHHKIIDLNQRQIIQQFYRKSLFEMKRNQIESRNFHLDKNHIQNQNAHHAKQLQKRRFQYV